MKIFLTDQAPNFEGLLRQLVTQPIMSYDRTKLQEKTTTIDIETERALEQIDLDVLFNYGIFPSNIMSYLTQWGQENRKMRVGDTILQQVFIPPIKQFSQKAVFGVRVNCIIDETDRKSFSYETVEGHVERGESSFTLERLGNGLIFKIRTFSEPGNFLTKLLGPILTVPYQSYCTRRALEHVKGQLER
jgi:hypothetical protein